VAIRVRHRAAGTSGNGPPGALAAAAAPLSTPRREGASLSRGCGGSRSVRGGPSPDVPPRAAIHRAKSAASPTRAGSAQQIAAPRADTPEPDIQNRFESPPTPDLVAVAVTRRRCPSPTSSSARGLRCRGVASTVRHPAPTANRSHCLVQLHPVVRRPDRACSRAARIRGRRAWRRFHHAPAGEHVARAAGPRSALERDSARGHPLALAPGALRPHHPAAGGRRRARGPLRQPAVSGTGLAAGSALCLGEGATRR